MTVFLVNGLAWSIISLASLIYVALKIPRFSFTPSIFQIPFHASSSALKPSMGVPFCFRLDDTRRFCSFQASVCLRVYQVLHTKPLYEFLDLILILV